VTEQFNAGFLGHVHTATAPLYRSLAVGSNTSFLAARRLCVCLRGLSLGRYALLGLDFTLGSEFMHGLAANWKPTRD
jgi:hypothetical protein